MVSRTRFAKAFAYGVALAIGMVYCYSVSRSSSTANSDKSLRDDLVSVVSGRVDSVSLCKVWPSNIPRECVPLSEASKNKFATLARQATENLFPDHPYTINSYLIKINYIAGAQNEEQIYCVLGHQFAGKMDLYLSNVNAGTNCSNPTFGNAHGTARMPNFLDSPE